MPEVIPYLLYEDAASALEFLARAFGFHETARHESEGRVAHAEMKIGDERIMLGQPAEGFRNPKHLGANTTLMYIYIDDVDNHCVRARDAGAEIVDEPTDQEYGDRHYHARDPEGHDWYFAQQARVPAEA
jgi:uncharacterized glyoxalase superfamily protein PhnB